MINVYDVSISVTRKNGCRERRSYIVQATSINRAVAIVRQGFCKPSDVTNSVSAYLLSRNMSIGEYMKSKGDHAQTGQPATERE